MATAKLPETIPQSDASTMTFEEIEGEHWEITRWSGDDSQPFFVPAHWHEYHDEVITLLKGAVDIYRDGLWERFDADPTKEITITRTVVHSFRGVKGSGPLEFRERTLVYGPLKDQPEFKACFFRDLFVRPNPAFLHVMRVFWDGDTYAYVPHMPKFVGQAVTGFFAHIAMMLGDRKLLQVEDLRRMR